MAGKSKGKAVTINITSIQSLDDHSEKTELMTDGIMRKMDSKSHGYTLSYKESEATGFAGLETLITCIGNNYASMQRGGDAPTNLIIERDKKHHCVYSTPYGSIDMGIFAHDIRNNMTENGGEIYLKYTIDMNSAYISDNELIINVKAD